MNKLLILISLLFLIVSCGKQEVLDNSIKVNQEFSNEQITKQIIDLQPEYKADLYGKIKSNEGNIYTIIEFDTTKDPTINMSIEEKQKYMQSLSEADREALKLEISKAVIGEIKVTIPVGIPMIKKELIGDEKLDIEASLEDLKNGDIVSIWYDKNQTDRKIALYVKRSFRK